MAKRTDIKKIMVIGSGPIIIGQAAEFDYAGTQACLALKQEGYEVILLNSNPATIMTDSQMADKIYMEPLTIEYVSKIIRKERPDAVIPSLGGQTGLNLVVELSKKGVLDECQVEILGTSLYSIQQAEDRKLFKTLCEKIGEPIIKSKIAETVGECLAFADEIGYPIMLRPAYTLGGTGGGFAYDKAHCLEIATGAISLSPTSQVLIEKSLHGYKEIEFEVIRDKTDRAMIVCDMENVDPVGVHTGDSIVVAPCMTLEKDILEKLKQASLNIIRALKIEGGCNVQYALDPQSNNYYVIEVNPRVSRSSALASKATSYPIAHVTTKIAVGYTLDEIKIMDVFASNSPVVNYKVIKMARFYFDKFKDVNRQLGTQMKATGEVMAIGETFTEGFSKALRSLENTYDTLDYIPKEGETVEYLLKRIETADDERIYIIGYLLKQGIPVDKIAFATKIAPYFIEEMALIVKTESQLSLTEENITQAKKLGLSDNQIAKKLSMTEKEIRNYRIKHHIIPNYRMVDACAKAQYVPYMYASYHKKDNNVISNKEKIVILGSGPIRIGQGVEFDYATVHCIQTIKEMGYEAIVINNNPETVSTDFTMSDKLYFEPLTIEDVLNVIDRESPIGVVVQLGGQTAINLADKLEEAGVQILGTSSKSIDLAENRNAFEHLLNTLIIKQPKGKTISDKNQGKQVAKELGYPLLVRPSFVLGGQSMRIVYNDTQLVSYLEAIQTITEEKPVLMDKYIKGKEVELDAICDGTDVFIPGIMEHIEKTGVHSGDSMSVYPTFSLNKFIIDKIKTITKSIGLALQIKGLFNIQFIVDENDEVYIIEVNPRASRSVPFISKVCNINISDIATKIMLNQSLKQQGITTNYLEVTTHKYYVKVPTFSFSKIQGLDTSLGPEMKSTGEAIGYDTTLSSALCKALQASGMKINNYGTVFITVADEDKLEMLDIAKRFYDLGFNIVATKNTQTFLKTQGLNVKVLRKLSEDSNEIIEWITKGYIKYIVNTQSTSHEQALSDGYLIRTTAAQNNITTFTSLDTAKVLLSVLEKRSLTVDTL